MTTVASGHRSPSLYPLLAVPSRFGHRAHAFAEQAWWGTSPRPRSEGGGMKKRPWVVVSAAAASFLLATGIAAAGGGFDFGIFRDQQLAARSEPGFGVGKPIPQ